MNQTLKGYGFSMAVLKYFRTMVSFLLFIGFSSVQAAESSDYLDALSQEADSTSSIAKAAPSESSSDMSEMETKLKVQKPATYKFYLRLAQDDKKTVFATYNSNAASERERITHIQKKVMDLYFK